MKKTPENNDVKIPQVALTSLNPENWENLLKKFNEALAYMRTVQKTKEFAEKEEAMLDYLLSLAYSLNEAMGDVSIQKEEARIYVYEEFIKTLEDALRENKTYGPLLQRNRDAIEAVLRDPDNTLKKRFEKNPLLKLIFQQHPFRLVELAEEKKRGGDYLSKLEIDPVYTKIVQESCKTNRERLLEQCLKNLTEGVINHHKRKPGDMNPTEKKLDACTLMNNPAFVQRLRETEDYKKLEKMLKSPEKAQIALLNREKAKYIQALIKVLLVKLWQTLESDMTAKAPRLEPPSMYAAPFFGPVTQTIENEIKRIQGVSYNVYPRLFYLPPRGQALQGEELSGSKKFPFGNLWQNPILDKLKRIFQAKQETQPVIVTPQDEEASFFCQEYIRQNISTATEKEMAQMAQEMSLQAFTEGRLPSEQARFKEDPDGLAGKLAEEIWRDILDNIYTMRDGLVNLLIHHGRRLPDKPNWVRKDIVSFKKPD